MCSHARFARVWDPFNMLTVIKGCFLESVLNKSFTVCNFRNKVAMKIIFFLKMFKISSGTKKHKKFFVSKIIAFQFGTTNSHSTEQDTFHWQSMY